MRAVAHIPPTRDLLLVGGGHAHAIVLRRFAMRPLPGARLTLVDPNPTTIYSGMLPGHIAGDFTLDEISIDLVKLARWADARLILDRATALDPRARSVTLSSGRVIDYDLLSVDIGSTSEPREIADPHGVAIPVKPLGAFLPALEAFVADVALGRRPPSARVIGAGVGGIELALALRARLRRAGAESPDIAALERAPTPLPSLSGGARRRLLEAIAKRGIGLQADCGAVALEPLPEGRGVRIRSAAGEETVGAVFAAAGAAAPGWIAASGLETDEAGFIAVDARLRSRSHKTVFAAGDIAAMTESPRAKSGVFAVRQGPVLAHNLEQALRGRALRRYRPQKTWLKLVSLGERRAFGEKAGVAIDGPDLFRRALWRWKERIDRRFMARFEPTPMTPPPPPERAALGVAEAAAGAMLCAGCGSKVGEGALRAALARLPEPPASAEAGAPIEILQGIGDDAAVLGIGGGPPVVWTTDHFRAFIRDPDLLARIAVQHALGDIRAMGARPVSALLSLTLEEAAPPLQSRDLTAALAGARAALDEAGAALVGGHSALGAEMAIGVSALGTVENDRWLGLDGARAGELLVLTRPIGVGVLLAGEMAMKARGRDVAAAWRAMAEDRGVEAALIARHASAATDVTGFGLLGHLMSLLEASGLDAALSLDAVPLLPGAMALSEAGVESSLAPANRTRSEPALEADGAARAHPAYPLLFDPQTAGGFLASIPARAEAALIGAGRAQGIEITVIGRTLPRAGAAAQVRLRAGRAD